MNGGYENLKEIRKKKTRGGGLATSTHRVPNSPTGQVLEAGPGWPVLVMAMTGPN